ncbi:MAG: Ycf66 family protein [Nodosilinea sp.]
MVGQGLAIVVGLGSIALYGAAFFFPEIHRKHDFFWSGVGLFYALVLWLNGDQSSPTEILGHCASISLMGWWGWQTLTLRRRRTPLALQTPFTEDSWPSFRREMAELGLAFLRQTSLGRWLLRPRKGSMPSAQSDDAQRQLRASALKDVEYEFLDDLATVETASSPSPAALTIPVNSRRADPSPSPRPKPQGSSRVRRGQALLGWARDWGRSLTASKPKRPVIDIPPRPPRSPEKISAAPRAEPSLPISSGSGAKPISDSTEDQPSQESGQD